MDLDPFERDVLILGLGEDASYSEAVSLAIRKYAADEPLEEARDCALRTIEGLSRSGLVGVGTLDDRGNFVDRNDELDALVGRVRDVFDGSSRGLWRHVFRFRDTPAGARAVEPLPDGYNPFDEDRRSGTGR